MVCLGCFMMVKYHTQSIRSNDKYIMRQFINIIENQLPNTHLFPAGTIFYHGTDDDDFKLYRGIWVTDHIDVAKEFARRNAYGDGELRIISLSLNHPLELPVFYTSYDFDEYLEDNDISSYGAEDMRDDAVARNIPGWYIPNNYGSGQADIFITDISNLSIVDSVNF